MAGALAPGASRAVRIALYQHCVVWSKSITAFFNEFRSRLKRLALRYVLCHIMACISAAYSTCRNRCTQQIGLVRNSHELTSLKIELTELVNKIPDSRALQEWTESAGCEMILGVNLLEPEVEEEQGSGAGSGASGSSRPEDKARPKKRQKVE